MSPGPEAADPAAPVVVVSSDSHIGPHHSQLRPYCPSSLLEDFDRVVQANAQHSARLMARLMMVEPAMARRDGRPVEQPSMEERMLENRRTAGHNDVAARLADMDRDGVAAAVIFDGSQNGQQIPFVDFERSFRGELPEPANRPLEAEGMRIFNRWLADFCSTEPARHIALCKVPIWDIEASVTEILWAKEHGFRGVRFPAGTAGLAPYEDPFWEPLFACCAETGMPLVAHISGAEQVPPEYTGRGVWGIRAVESVWLARRPIWLLTFTGAFERHPGLRLVLTEVPGVWWEATVREMDSAYLGRHARRSLQAFLPRRPSEYVREHVWVGASFQSRAEALHAVEAGAVDRMMWGSDYPHAEGTWMFTDDPNEASTTRLSMANTFNGLDGDDVRRMAGLNAVECYGLDATALARVARRIGPSLGELTEPPDLGQVPERYQGYGFREYGAWA